MNYGGDCRNREKLVKTFWLSLCHLHLGNGYEQAIALIDMWGDPTSPQ